MVIAFFPARFALKNQHINEINWCIIWLSFDLISLTFSESKTMFMVYMYSSLYQSLIAVKRLLHVQYAKKPEVYLISHIMKALIPLLQTLNTYVYFSRFSCVPFNKFQNNEIKALLFCMHLLNIQIISIDKKSWKRSSPVLITSDLPSSSESAHEYNITFVQLNNGISGDRICPSISKRRTANTLIDM